LSESHFNDIIFGQVRGVVQDSVLGWSARSLGDFLGNQIEIPIFLGNSVFTDNGTWWGIEKSFLILREESFGNSLLDNDFHKLGIIFKIWCGNVFEGL